MFLQKKYVKICRFSKINKKKELNNYNVVQDDGCSHTHIKAGILNMKLIQLLHEILLSKRFFLQMENHYNIKAKSQSIVTAIDISPKQISSGYSYSRSCSHRKSRNCQRQKLGRLHIKEKSFAARFNGGPFLLNHDIYLCHPIPAAFPQLITNKSKVYFQLHRFSSAT